MKNYQENSEDHGLQDMELKANLNPEQRAYLEVLKDKMKKVLGNKTKQELAKVGDLVTLKNYKAVLEEILKFLQTKEIKIVAQELVFNRPDGSNMKIDIPEVLEHWTAFYEKAGIDWVKLPNEVELTVDNIKDLQKAGELLCAHSKQYEKLRLIVVPEGLADNGDKYTELFNKMAIPYVDQRGNIYSHIINDFLNDLYLKEMNNKNNSLRLILVRNWQFSDEDDEDARPITNQVVAKLEEPGALFEKTGMRGLDMATYLVWQRDHFLRTGKALDFDNKYILLSGSGFENKFYRPAVAFSDSATVRKIDIKYEMFDPSGRVSSGSICPIGKEIEIAT